MPYSEKAWACVQDGITQRGRLADGDMTTSPSGPIPELCNAILNTCQIPSRFYIIPSNVNKSQTHLLKSFLARDLIWWRAIYAGKTRWSLLWCFVLNCVHAPPHVLSLPSCCEKSDSWRQARSVKTAKKSHERYHNVVMWHWIVYKWRRSNQMLSFHRTFFNLLDFTVSLSCKDWHSKTPWSHSSNQPGGTYCQAQDFLLRTNCTLEMWCANTKSANQVPSSPVKHLSFQCLGVIFALNGKSASMLLEPTKNKLKHWRVIEKSVNNCNFFPRYFEIITKWMKKTDKFVKIK